MGSRMNRSAYNELIDEDTAWLQKEAPPSLERSHIVCVLEQSVELLYPTPPQAEEKPNDQAD